MPEMFALKFKKKSNYNPSDFLVSNLKVYYH